MTERSVLKEVDQGTIFTGGASQVCGGEPVMGVVLSARCDLARQKIDAVAYSPAISIDVFISNIIVDVAKKELEEEKKRVVKNLLLKHDETLEHWVNIYGVEKVFETSGGELAAKDKDKASSVISEIKKLRERRFFDFKEADDVALAISKRVRAYIKDVAENKREGLFLIDGISGYGVQVAKPHIVNLREIRFVDLGFLKKVSEGFSPSCRSEIHGSDVYHEEGFFYNVVSKIKSPYLELMIQKFANQFLRIGVEDVDVESVIQNTEFF